MASNYDILGVSPTASKQEIRRAYHKLSLLYHPDMATGDQEQFLKIKEAYDTLMLFRPNNTHNIHTESESFVTVYGQSINKMTGDITIDVSFSRDMMHAKLMGNKGITDRWTLLGLNGGHIEIRKRTLIENKYKFTLLFTNNRGQIIAKGFQFADPRSKATKFSDKISEPIYFIRALIRIIIFIAIYYLISNLFKHT